MEIAGAVGILILVGIAVVVLIVVGLIVLLFARSWIKVARADEALVISGRKQKVQRAIVSADGSSSSEIVDSAACSPRSSTARTTDSGSTPAASAASRRERPPLQAYSMSIASNAAIDAGIIRATWPTGVDSSILMLSLMRSNVGCRLHVS